MSNPLHDYIDKMIFEWPEEYWDQNPFIARQKVLFRLLRSNKIYTTAELARLEDSKEPSKAYYHRLRNWRNGATLPSTQREYQEVYPREMTNAVFFENPDKISKIISHAIVLAKNSAHINHNPPHQKLYLKARLNVADLVQKTSAGNAMPWHTVVGLFHDGFFELSDFKDLLPDDLIKKIETVISHEDYNYFSKMRDAYLDIIQVKGEVPEEYKGTVFDPAFSVPYPAPKTVHHDWYISVEDREKYLNTPIDNEMKWAMIEVYAYLKPSQFVYVGPAVYEDHNKEEVLEKHRSRSLQYGLEKMALFKKRLENYGTKLDGETLYQAQIWTSSQQPYYSNQYSSEQYTQEILEQKELAAKIRRICKGREGEFFLGKTICYNSISFKTQDKGLFDKVMSLQEKTKDYCWWFTCQLDT
jgi:hypothetical protein